MSEWLEEALEAFDAGELGRARQLAHARLAQQPKDPRALQLLASTYAEEGELDQAESAFERGLEQAPDDPELLLGAADFYIRDLGEERACAERGVALAERTRKRAKKMKDQSLWVDALLLEGIGLNQLGECEAALTRLDEALAFAPEFHEARLERALALFELCRFDACEAALLELVAMAPDEPWVHHYLGLLHERRGRSAEAQRCFGTARKLAPEDFFSPTVLDEEAFDLAVEDAIERLPERVKAYLGNTTVAVEPFPSDEDLLSGSPPLSPCILGVFRGVPVGERSVTSSHDHFPASIVLYQRNLERFARTREELVEQIGITVMHEVGHLIGLDEDDLWERGLE
jgi:predicted Zn-dependent protease with MMP-like domain/predicted Zn-dependent protease